MKLLEKREECQMSKAIFQLEPLTCPSCIKKIESTLSKTPGIDSVTVLFHSSKVKAEFNPAEIAASQIEETLTKLGYEVRSAKLA